ncbi:hypothetical protein NHQ30_001117 [Ciborinia camelliae]|nr:hypothetical protein NHQ30_001117 [Ciborinia camelliae]
MSQWKVFSTREFSASDFAEWELSEESTPEKEKENENEDLDYLSRRIREIKENDPTHVVEPIPWWDFAAITNYLHSRILQIKEEENREREERLTRGYDDSEDKIFHTPGAWPIQQDIPVISDGEDVSDGEDYHTREYEHSDGEGSYTPGVSSPVHQDIANSEDEDKNTPDALAGFETIGINEHDHHHDNATAPKFSPDGETQQEKEIPTISDSEENTPDTLGGFEKTIDINEHHHHHHHHLNNAIAPTFSPNDQTPASPRPSEQATAADSESQDSESQEEGGYWIPSTATSEAISRKNEAEALAELKNMLCKPPEQDQEQEQLRKSEYRVLESLCCGDSVVGGSADEEEDVCVCVGVGVVGSGSSELFNLVREILWLDLDLDE